MTTDNTTPRPDGDDTPVEPVAADSVAPTPEAPAEPELVEPAPAEPAPAVPETAAEPEPAPVAEPAPQPTTQLPTAPPTAHGQQPEPAVDPAPAAETAPAANPAPAAADPDPATEPAADTTAAPQVVYVDAPQRPKKRGTRGVGLAVVLLSTGVFAVLYALATIALALALRPDGLNGFASYLASAPFFVPVLVFAGAHLLLVLVANRAGWWMHVLGGFLVAVLVWVSFLGAALIAAGAIGATEAQQQSVILQQLVNPLGIIAAVLAREIPIWVGGIVARRGRTQTARNAEALAAYERDLAAHRASVQPAAPAS
ncbi:hypothetical protein [Microcella alkaliphila]|uniref:Proteoglycan 4 n=1 Tax=Microcella alkaliphila TaxID=279828 RepID=A0A0U5B607_9MICO|nr:hypothetical protein [Microcella alkaliphila]BAU31353.1 proteoglycan 4 [Microcella alkaliphila]